MRRRISKPSAKPSALRRLGLAAPPPFFGRVREFADLERLLRECPLIIVTGIVGSGKTRLARETATRLDLLGDLRASYVRCEEGDLAGALVARAERTLDVLPGSLPGVLQQERRLLLIDDLHHLPPHEASRVLAGLIHPTSTGRVVAFTRDSLPLHRNDPSRADLSLDGLDEGAARDLWAHLEDLYGPTPAGACDDAIARTRGMPLAMRREYARASVGADAWTIDKLDDDGRAALEAAAVLRLPAAPAAIAALIPEIDAEGALATLVSQQLLDPVDDGRFAMHDIVREEVLACLDGDRRRELERAAADLTLDAGRSGRAGRRIQWEVRDGAALGLADPVDRMREGIRHLVASGDVSAAVDRLVDAQALLARRGCGGEVLALIDSLEGTNARQRAALDRVRADVAARHGRVASALEIWERLPHGKGAAGGLAAARTAYLTYLSGDVAAADESLRDLAEHDDADVRGIATAALAAIELARGHMETSRRLAADALERDRARLGDEARTHLGIALGAAEEAAGRTTAARASLSRAASAAGTDPALGARVCARLAGCLVLEGRLSDAEAALVEAETGAREVDEVAVAEELRRRRAGVDARRGRLGIACDTLREIVDSRRARGDEVGALRAEIDLAAVLEARGHVSSAAELAAACAQSAARRGLDAFAVEARLIAAAVDASELRLDEAAEQLVGIAAAPAATEAVRQRAVSLLELVRAWSSGSAPADDGALYCDDEIVGARMRSSIALAAGEVVQALDAARSASVWAERAGRLADMADALAMAARLYLARGDKSSANAAATRAVREGRSCGLTRAQARGLLVLAALRREAGDQIAALSYARDALELASDAGLAFERLVAAEAIDVIDDTPGDENRAARDAAAATMSEYAIRSATQALADLGLTAARPYRLVNGNGQDSFVADANPGLLRLEDRSLAIDGVREIILRDGSQIADLRRRSLLKRLLFLLAASPARTFSKEEIVQTVWEVEYHPLRHDAALFTNIMRIRRLLGKDGADLIRVSEDGYRFCAPSDFLFVENVAEA